MDSNSWELLDNDETDGDCNDNLEKQQQQQNSTRYGQNVKNYE